MWWRKCYGPVLDEIDFSEKKTLIFIIFDWTHRLRRLVKNFLWVKTICLSYLDGAPKSGLSNASTPMVIRRIDEYKSLENQILKDFFKNPLRNFDLWLEIFIIFDWTPRLRRLVKNFLCVKTICFRYLEGPPKSGLSNAPTPMVIRRIDQKSLQIFNFFGKKPTLRYLFESDFSY